MAGILDFVQGIFAEADYFTSLLLFLLLIFGGLYILFKIIFSIGDSAPKRREKREDSLKKREEALKKKEEENEKLREAMKKEAEERKREKEERAKEAKANKERILKEKEEKEKLVFLEEERPYIETRPYYSREHHDSYVVGRYDSEVKNYSYGDNYLYEYYNNGKTVNTYITEPERKVVETPKNEEMVAKSDELIETYKDLPTELKRYILNKILSSSNN